jgi:hypothetical protein
MYINGKMRLVETIPGFGERGERRMMECANSSIIYLIYYKNFCKCHKCTPSTTIKKEK